MTQHPTSNRLPGLDTLRALAIALVLMSHYAGFVSQVPTFGWIGHIGWAGVDLFFVLSGYLIGQQLLAGLARGDGIPLKTFFARRLLRTVPNYYAILALYILFPGPISGSSTAPLWRFLTFSQNLGQAYGQTFTHSWSLCIEEQFYLVLPLAALAVARLPRCRRAGWWLIGAAIAAGMAARAISWCNGHTAFDAEIYYSTFCRSDELLFGVAIAVLRNFHGELFARILRHGNALLLAGFGAAVALLYCLGTDLSHGLFATTFAYSLLAASFALLTLAALSPASLLGRARIPGATRVALWSYAIYLAHKPLFMAVRPQLLRLHIDPASPYLIAPIFLAGILAGWLLFYLVETPLMRLRDRHFPALPGKNSAAPGVPAAAAGALGC